MPVLRSLHDHQTRSAILARLDALGPDTPGRWGRMNAHQMICHLNDMLRFALGERDGPAAGGWLHHTVLRWYALTMPFRWPHGFPTARQFDQERGGTPPKEFQADRAELVETIHRFTAPDATLLHHPLFGPLSRAEWGRWGFRHCDHHLRQFGV